MRVRLTIKGPSVGDLIVYLETNYQWAFSAFEQTDTMNGWAIGWHQLPEEFIGIGINDGTYIKSMELEVDDGQGLSE